MHNSNFLNIHRLRVYSSACVNRDKEGHPKSIVFGDSRRGRISSQCDKKATRDAFREHFGNDLMSLRSKSYPLVWLNSLLNGGVDRKFAVECVKRMAERFATISEETLKTFLNGTVPDETDEEESKKKDSIIRINSLERKKVKDLLEQITKTKVAPTDKEIDDLRDNSGITIDTAFFGDMVPTGVSVDGAVCVSHAFTVNSFQEENDFFVATNDILPDDLFGNSKAIDGTQPSTKGSSHLGSSKMMSGVFYSVYSVNKPLLISNLKGNVQKAKKGLDILINTLLFKGPRGRINTMFSHEYASYILAEIGDDNRVLSAGYVNAINDNVLVQAARVLENYKRNSDVQTCKVWNNFVWNNVPEYTSIFDSGNADSLKEFVTGFVG